MEKIKNNWRIFAFAGILLMGIFKYSDLIISKLPLTQNKISSITGLKSLGSNEGSVASVMADGSTDPNNSGTNEATPAPWMKEPINNNFMCMDGTKEIDDLNTIANMPPDSLVCVVCADLEIKGQEITLVKNGTRILLNYGFEEDAEGMDFNYIVNYANDLANNHPDLANNTVVNLSNGYVVNESANVTLVPRGLSLADTRVFSCPN